MHDTLTRKAVTEAFSWHKFRARRRDFGLSGWPSRERWFLAYLHSEYALSELAQATARALTLAARPSAVSLQSVWIDGTPQASAFATGGRSVACELADLLFILQEHDVRGGVTARSGLLLQAKIARKHDRLPSGASTRKERLLLENLDRGQPLELYRDTGRSAGAQIGSYTLGGTPPGLKDCARYVLIPKELSWGSAWYWAPYLVGWPPSSSSPCIRPPTGIVHAIQRAAVAQAIGRPLNDRDQLKGCEWSRMVWDLLGDYGHVIMAGYGGQRRVNTSAVMSFLASPTVAWDLPAPGARRRPTLGPRMVAPPPDRETPAVTLDDGGPAISVIVITVRALDSEERRE